MRPILSSLLDDILERLPHDQVIRGRIISFPIRTEPHLSRLQSGSTNSESAGRI
jgi:hypothetical protein